MGLRKACALSPKTRDCTTTEMEIQRAIKSINSYTRRWVRVERVRNADSELELCFTIHRGKNGTKVHSWIVACSGVHEASITDFNGGGLALYPSNHPAARQYIAPQANLRWPRACDGAKVLSALWQAHLNAVGDWIPLDRYLFVDPLPSENRTPPCFRLAPDNSFACVGPDFLLRTYAKAIKSTGTQMRLTVRAKRKSDRPSVLHFGSSYVVAKGFTANRDA